MKAELVNALAGSVPFLRLAGTAPGRLAARQERARWPRTKLAARDGDPAFLEAKLVTARFYAEVILPPALAVARAAQGGRPYGLRALREEQFERRLSRA